MHIIQHGGGGLKLNSICAGLIQLCSLKVLFDSFMAQNVLCIFFFLVCWSNVNFFLDQAIISACKCSLLNLAGETDINNLQDLDWFVTAVLQLEGLLGQRGEMKKKALEKPVESLIFKLTFQNLQKLLKSQGLLLYIAFDTAKIFCFLILLLWRQ